MYRLCRGQCDSDTSANKVGAIVTTQDTAGQEEGGAGKETAQAKTDRN
jgi:hypothetical protein